MLSKSLIQTTGKFAALGRYCASSSRRAAVLTIAAFLAISVSAQAAEITVKGLDATVKGEVFAEVLVDEPIREVHMQVPGMINRIERHSPYGLMSDSGGKLHPLDTTKYRNGDYVLTVVATLENGQKVSKDFAFEIRNPVARAATVEPAIHVNTLPDEVRVGQTYTVRADGIAEGETVFFHLFDHRWRDVVRSNLQVVDGTVTFTIPEKLGKRRLQLQYGNQHKPSKMLEVIPASVSAVPKPAPQPEPEKQPEPETKPEPAPEPETTPEAQPEVVGPFINTANLPTQLLVGQRVTLQTEGIEDGQLVFYHVFNRQWGDLHAESVKVADGKIVFTIPNKTGERLLQLQYRSDFKQNTLVTISATTTSSSPETEETVESQDPAEPQQEEEIPADEKTETTSEPETVTPEPDVVPEPESTPEPEATPELKPEVVRPFINTANLPTQLLVGQRVTLQTEGIEDGQLVFYHVFNPQWGDLHAQSLTVKDSKITFTVPSKTGDRLLQLQYKSKFKKNTIVSISNPTVQGSPDTDETVESEEPTLAPSDDAPVSADKPDSSLEPTDQPTDSSSDPEVVNPEPEVVNPEPQETEQDQPTQEPTTPNATKVLRVGSGFSGATEVPGQIGDRHERAIAHWNVVPEQTIGNGFTVGVIAHHIDGIDRVEISANGGKWISITEPTINPRTKCEEYWAELDLSGHKGKIAFRAIAYPKRGKPYLVKPMGGTYSKQDLTLYSYAVGEVLELPAGEHELPRRDLPATGWLIVRPKPGVAREDCILVKVGTNWKHGRLKLENLTIKMPAGGSGLRGNWATRDDGQHLWLDKCNVIGNGPKNQTWWTAHLWETFTMTGTEVSHVQSVVQSHGLVRNCYFHHIYEDIFRVPGLHVNVTIEDMDRSLMTDAQPGAEAPHPDIWQSQSLKNTIAQDITATKNINAQGFFPGDSLDVALVRLHIKTVSPYRAIQMMGDTSNVLVQKCRFDGGANFRGQVLPGERLMLRDTTAGFSPPYLPKGWEAEGVHVLPKPPVYD